MRGFILQPTYRIESGRPVVHLYGRLEAGAPFLIRDATDVPHFFIRVRDEERARGLGAAALRPTGLRTMEGEEVLRVEVAIPSETPPLRDRLAAAGVQPFEADVRFAMRFLIDRGLKGAVEIHGEPKEAPPASGPPPLLVFESPKLAPSDWAPKLRVLSLDIETDPRGQRVFAVALHEADHFEVLYVVPPGGRSVRRAAVHDMRSKALDAASPVAGRASPPREPGGAAGGQGDRGGPAPAGQGASEPSEGPGGDGAGSESGGAGEPAGTGLPGSFTETPCATEAELIGLLCKRVADLDPDVLTGWNVVDFDLRVLEAAARRAGAPLRLGRTGESIRIRVEEGVRRTSRAEVAGRIVLDGIDLLRGAFVRLEDYRLETAARTLLGKGKLIASRDRGEEIERLYHEDLEAFLEYNANDARLVTEILEKTGVVDLAVRRSLLTGMPPDRVSASIASFDSLYLPELRRRGVVAPSVGGAETVEATAGGAVLEPVTGLHENVLVFDFRSLYPSLIRTFNIDPLGLVRDPAAPGTRTEWIEAPNGARFGREPGILPALLDRLSSERAAARARGDAIASQAIKILMNSCYGVLATPACRFYSAAVANAITHFGQATLRWTKERAEAQGYAVLYGDTDSLFVAAGTGDEAEARRRGEHLVSRLNRDLSEHVREAHGVVSRLELEMQCLYRRLFLPSLRHGTAGARKRYAGLIVEGGKESIHFTGMEMVRRDWTELSKIFQRGLFERVFHGEDPGPWIREFIDELRGGAHDGHLVYRKALRKPISEYTATTPPHVKAAKVLGARPGQIIDYVMTVNGPEPAAARTGSFDYAHYVDRQIRPVAEAVLTHLGLDFDDLAGTDDGAGRQLDLFG